MLLWRSARQTPKQKYTISYYCLVVLLLPSSSQNKNQAKCNVSTAPVFICGFFARLFQNHVVEMLFTTVSNIMFINQMIIYRVESSVMGCMNLYPSLILARTGWVSLV